MDQALGWALGYIKRNKSQDVKSMQFTVEELKLKTRKKTGSNNFILCPA